MFSLLTGKSSLGMMIRQNAVREHHNYNIIARRISLINECNIYHQMIKTMIGGLYSLRLTYLTKKQ